MSQPSFTHILDFLVLKMLSSHYICCIFSNVIQTTYASDTMNHDQTAPVNIVCNIMYKFIRLGRGTQLLSQMAGK